MKKIENQMQDVRVEVVTTTFVASGRPEGHPGPRSLHRSAQQSAGVAPDHADRSGGAAAVSRVGPAAPRCGAADPPRRDRLRELRRAELRRSGSSSQVDAPVLLLAPPFQIQGLVSLPAGTDPTQALRGVVGRLLRRAQGVGLRCRWQRAGRGRADHRQRRGRPDDGRHRPAHRRGVGATDRGDRADARRGRGGRGGRGRYGSAGAQAARRIAPDTRLDAVVRSGRREASASSRPELAAL